MINLHSNLVIFKLCHQSFLVGFHAHLHSNLVIFKFISPITLLILESVFTFQSGDIQIERAGILFIPFCLFTFQSGDIQIQR